MEENRTKTDSKRLIKTRQEFNDWTKKELNKWQTIKGKKENKRLEELQNQEIEAISKQLAQLRDEYNRIAAERGSAHKWALVVDKHERELTDAMTRRDVLVSDRSKRVLADFIDHNIIEQMNAKIDKRYQIVRRKQIMKSSITANTNRQLASVEGHKDSHEWRKYETNVIKKTSNPMHCAKDDDINNERPFVPKKTTSELESNSSHFNYSPKRISDKIKGKENSKVNQKSFEIESRQTKVMKSLRQLSEERENGLPIDIAIKLYDKLKVRRNLTSEQTVRNQKIYRNVAISTTPSLSRRTSIIDMNEVAKSQLFSNEENETLDKGSEISSLQTTYMSIPNVAVPSNRITVGWKELCKKYLTLRDNQSRDQIRDVLELNLNDTTVIESSDQLIDPLISRINNLKELIDRNVGTDEPQNNDILSAGDSIALQDYDRVSKLSEDEELIQDLQEDDMPEDIKLQDGSSLISSSSSATFKTLPVITSSGRTSPSDGSWLQKSIDMSKVLPSNDSTDNSIEVQSISSSFAEQPLRDRNAFWKEVFERAGIDIDMNRIDDWIGNQRAVITLTNSDSFASFTLSSLSCDHNLHSTPKR